MTTEKQPPRRVGISVRVSAELLEAASWLAMERDTTISELVRAYLWRAVRALERERKDQ